MPANEWMNAQQQKKGIGPKKESSCRIKQLKLRKKSDNGNGNNNSNNKTRENILATLQLLFLKNQTRRERKRFVCEIQCYSVEQVRRKAL